MLVSDGDGRVVCVGRRSMSGTKHTFCDRPGKCETIIPRQYRVSAYFIAVVVLYCIDVINVEMKI